MNCYSFMKRLIPAGSYRRGWEGRNLTSPVVMFFLMKLVLDSPEVSSVLRTHFTIQCYPLVLAADQVVGFHLDIFKGSSRFGACLCRAFGAVWLCSVWALPSTLL